MGLGPIDSCGAATTGGSSFAITRTAGSTNPCFAKVNQNASTSSLPRFDAGWAQEISLDVDMVSAICPTCDVLLVEASTNSLANLASAVTTASHFSGVHAVSNSYGTGTDLSTSYTSAYADAANRGIAVTVSTGDAGYGASWPATVPQVVAVGGTSLYVDSSGNRTSESAWSSAGSGCSASYAAPSWSAGKTVCGSGRPEADVSAVADPNTGVSVYYSGNWYVFGGTSVSSPILASWLAQFGTYSTSAMAPAWVWGSGTAWYDVVTGSNGSCGTAVCDAGPGWDGPTGLGSLPGPKASATPSSTSTSLSTSAATVPQGASVTFTASVTSAGGTVSAGSVTFSDGSTPLGTVTVSSTGAASLSTSSLSAGSHTISASYGGSTTFAASTSPTVTVTVTASSPPPRGKHH